MSAELIAFLSTLERPRVGVIGDLMLDEYVWGQVERVSPEAPIPVLRVDRRDFRAGGAGSVIVNLARLGAEVSVFSIIGGDDAGTQVVDIFQDEGCNLDGLIRDGSRPTTRKARHIGCVQHADRAVQQILRVDEEDRSPPPAHLRAQLSKTVLDRLGELDALLVSDYDKGLLDEELLRSIVGKAGELPVLVDPARRSDYDAYRGVSLICPNRYEAELASGIECRDLDGCGRAGESLRKKFGIDCVMVTMDREGILVCDAGGAHHVPTRARVIADVTGAGDMVLSVLGLVVAGGGSLENAAKLANIAGGIEVRHVGVTPIQRSELVSELRYAGHPVAEKLKTLDELRPIVDQHHRAGRKVVFTNGCFDLLHRGHHEVLHGAALEGDVLIVAINSDASIRRLKGPTRPSIPEDGRVRMLAGLQFVDYVLVFSEDTPDHLLEGLRPDVLVKGGEYRDGVVVGHEIVEAYGGRIAYVNQVPGHSTTALLGETPDAS